MDIENEESSVALDGGIANQGAVVRIGRVVYRPATKQTPAIHRLLQHINVNGFTEAPKPIGIENDRESSTFIEGIVASFPYDDWCVNDTILEEVAAMLRRYHEAQTSFQSHDTDEWCLDLADPDGGNIICHNDVSLENVVFRNGKAVGLIDFEFAAPGGILWDIARSMLVWIPIDDPECAKAYRFGGLDQIDRMRIFCDSYGLPLEERPKLVDKIAAANLRTESFVRSQVEEGKPAFVYIWNTYELEKLYERRKVWLVENRAEIVRVLTSAE